MSARTAVVIISAALLVPGAASAGAQPGVAQPPAAATSSAAPAWGPVVKMGKNPMGSALVVDKKGTVTAVWEALTYQRSIVVRQHRPGHAWSKAKTIGRGFEPAVAVDAKGVVTVVWRGVRRGFTDGVLAARHPAGGRWSAPVRISRDVKIAGYPTDGDDMVGASDIHVAVGPVAGVVVTWQWGSYNRNRSWRIQSAVLPPGGHWQAPVAVTPPNWSRNPRVGIAGNGTTFVVFNTSADGDTRWPLRVRQRSPHGAWSAPKTIAPNHYGSWWVQLSVNRAGDAAVAYYSDFDQMSAVFKPRGQGWQPRERVAEGIDVSAYSTGILASGAVVAALSRPTGGVDFVRRSPGGTWTAPHQLDTSLTAEVSLATNPAGDILVCWGSMTLYASYLAHGGSWTSRFTVSPYLDALESFHTAVEADGDAAVLWDQEGAKLKARLMTG